MRYLTKLDVKREAKKKTFVAVQTREIPSKKQKKPPGICSRFSTACYFR